MILDVGANEGDTALRFSTYFPDARIHSFEPTSRVFINLLENVESSENITAVNVALGSENTLKTLHINELSTLTSFCTHTCGMGKEIGEERVKVVTLDCYASENSVETIDLLKIDTQGYEVEVLKGASELMVENRIRVIYVEVNFVQLYRDQAYFEDVYLLLRRHNFRLIGLYDRVYAKDGYLSWCDALFTNPASI